MVTVLLLTVALAAPDPTVAIRDVAVQPLNGALAVRWTTTVPTRGRVESTSGGQVANVEEDPSSLRGSTNAGQDTGAGYANNHRADLPLPETWPVRLRIVAETQAGETVVGEELTIQQPTPAKGNVERGQVQLTVDPGGWTAPSLPLTVGVPFAAGQLADPQRVRLLADTNPLPVQVEADTLWPDGTVKWLRVETVAPAAAYTLTLEFGSALPASAPLATRPYSEVEELDFDAGALKVTEGDRPAVTLTGPAGLLPVPSPVLTVSGDEQYQHLSWGGERLLAGPVHNVWRVASNRLQDRDGGTSVGEFDILLHTWQGLPFARVDFTYTNTRTDQEMTSFRALELWMPGVSAPSMRVGRGADSVPLPNSQSLLQREDSTWVITASNNPAAAPLAQGRRLDGAVEAGGPKVLIPNFWQQYPIGLTREADDLMIGLYPALPAGFYADRPDESKLYYHVRDGQYTFRQGFSKTHLMWLDLSGQDWGESLVDDPPTACADPQWIENSGAMRDLAVAVRDQFPEFDQRQQASIDRYLAVRDQAREYGVMSFGDWYGERTWNWGNLEYDLGHAFLMLYARSGYAPFFHRATEAVRHQRDVDTRHAAADPRRVGQQWIHSVGHTAGYYPPDFHDMKQYASAGWSDNRGHVWCQGMFEQYLLGGDRRSWDVARLIADWAAGPQTTNFRFFNAREPGWMLILVMSAYNATGDSYYLNAAHLMIRELRRMSEASGSRGFHYHALPNGHCDCEQKHSGEAGFMLGVQMTGMKMYYDATGDEQVADDLAKIAKFIVETMYEPKQKGFRYTSCPNTTVSGGSVFIELEGLAFAADRTRDPELVKVVREAVAASWDQIAGAGKSAGYMLCSLPQGLTQFSKLPGESLATQYTALQRWLRSPARRPLPALVPNGDFEEDAQGWVPRAGVRSERITSGARSGAGCLKLTIDCRGQNEYVNTRYDSSADPYEIQWLKPGESYRFTAWVKVERLSEGAPAPNLRLQFRDAQGSRNGVATTAYDLAQTGTWQKLTAEVTVPEWNTRNYLALNTNTREAVQGVVYLDDVSLVPVAVASRETYLYRRLDPPASAAVVPLPAQAGEAWLTGVGGAWRTDLPAGTYHVWLKVDGPAGPLAELSINGRVVATLQGNGEAHWAAAGNVQLPGGEVAVVVKPLADAARLGRLVLTNDPSVP